MRNRSLGILLIAVGIAVAQAPENRGVARFEELDAFIRQEVKDKEIPALSVAIVDNDRTVWSAGYGIQDPKSKAPATADTAYFVGSVSKLYTDFAVMRLVEQGKIDLDAPVAKYLPEFRPENPFDQPITLRHLMAHRSGLLREPPVGHYFDPTEPSLAEMVASLNQTKLLLKPGSKTKYSNAGLGVVGAVLERAAEMPYAKFIRENILKPLGMNSSDFEPERPLSEQIAAAKMWTYHGREFPAPRFRYGMAPAASLVSTVNDQAKLLQAIFAGGRPIVSANTLDAMLKPQFVDGAQAGFGLGFSVSEFEGKKRVGHGGAVYGFATEFAALPSEKLGVCVVSACDCANAVSSRIADESLRLMLAGKSGKPAPPIAKTLPVSREATRSLRGRYKSGDKVIDLIDRDSKLFADPGRGGTTVQIRRLDDSTLIVDDRLGYGTRIELIGPNQFRIGKDEYKRVQREKPAPCPERWRGLIGEYGWDHNTLYILEKDGKLHALIEWFFSYPLTEESENVFRFPDFGMYHDEKLIFERDSSGSAKQVVAAGIRFIRRKIDGENGKTFRIQPERPIDQLRKEALAANPPMQRDNFVPNELVELTQLDPSIRLDIRYASDNNFLGTPVYTSARAFLQRPAAEAVIRVHRKLESQGLGLLIHDGYRPWYVTKIFRDAAPAKYHLFVADPANGSRHNRGCAVDLTLFDRATGEAIRMPGGYDEFSDRSYPFYPGGTTLERWYRDLLREAMESEGFQVYEAEWWHFDYRDWRKYGLQNQPFEQIRN